MYKRRLSSHSSQHRRIVVYKTMLISHLYCDFWGGWRRACLLPTSDAYAARGSFVMCYATLRSRMVKPLRLLIYISSCLPENGDVSVRGLSYESSAVTSNPLLPGHCSYVFLTILDGKRSTLMTTRSYWQPWTQQNTIAITEIACTKNMKNSLRD